MARKLIYAFDFDGTIVTNKFPEIGIPILNTIELIRKVKSGGHYIILNTMREGDLLNEAVEYCKKLGIMFDAINDNLPHMKEFYKNNPRKIFANHYVDDHNLFVYGVNNCSDDIKELEKENKILKEELKCAETNFQTCNSDLAAIGELVGGSCYDHTYDLVKQLVDKSTPKKPVVAEEEDDYKTIYDEYGFVNPMICVCPNCGENEIYDFEYNAKFKHCTNCGQAIDWSDANA